MNGPALSLMQAPAHPPAPADADAAGAAAVANVSWRHARGFYFASMFLPKPRRAAARAVYAFCRLIREAFDVSADGQGCCSGGELEQRATMFRDRLAEIYDAGPTLPLSQFRNETQHVLAAFTNAVRQYEIPQEHFLTLADGWRRDVTVSRYATWAALERHSQQVAGPAGVAVACVLGLRHSDAGRYAVQLASAIRLTLILRNVAPDFARGKIYLPLEDLARFRYSERDLSQGILNDPFRDLMRFEINRARELYLAGATGICWLADDGSRLAVSSVAIMARDLLAAIERQHYDVFHDLPGVSAPRMARALPAAWRLARRQAEDPMPPVF